MRLSHDEPYDTSACNDTDACATVRPRMHRIDLAAPLHAQARPEVQTGLSMRLSPHLVAPVYGHAMEVLARSDRPRWEADHALYDQLQSLCQMGR
jgi:hypothetical protein